MAKHKPRTKADADTEAIKRALTEDRERRSPIPAHDWLSTGCTMLNLAITGRPFWGVPKGGYAFFVGDSSSGKTWFSFTILAEAARNKHFKDHRFIFDNAENGALMDIGYYFGERVEKRLEPPRGTRKNPQYSDTAQAFYFALDDAVNAGPCIYILDSMDALSDIDEEDVFETNKEAWRGGKDQAKNTMGMGKARTNSRNIKRIVNKLRKNGSILVVISQSRQNVTNPYGGKKNSGGDALKFYAHFQIFTSLRDTIKKKVRGRDREIGRNLGIDIRKNRITGWEGQLDVPFYRSVGFDDLGSVVDYLCAEKHWKKHQGEITAPEFDFVGKREALIRKVEEDDGERELQLLAGKVWKDIEAACAVRRKRRYQ